MRKINTFILLILILRFSTATKFHLLGRLASDHKFKMVSDTFNKFTNQCQSSNQSQIKQSIIKGTMLQTSSLAKDNNMLYEILYDKLWYVSCYLTCYITGNLTFYITCNVTYFITCNWTDYIRCSLTCYIKCNLTYYITCNLTFYLTCNLT